VNGTAGVVDDTIVEVGDYGKVVYIAGEVFDETNGVGANAVVDGAEVVDGVIVGDGAGCVGDGAKVGDGTRVVGDSAGSVGEST